MHTKQRAQEATHLELLLQFLHLRLEALDFRLHSAAFDGQTPA